MKQTKNTHLIICNKTPLPNNFLRKPKIKKTSKKLFGFTLVELIVVITILAILGTIAFVSFKGYSSSSRDSARMADMSNLNKTMDVYFSNASKYPMPDKYFSVTYSGGVVWYQGKIGDTVLNTINSSQVKLSEKPTDPLSNKEYDYSILANGSKYQVKVDIENKIALFNNNLNPIQKANATSMVNQINATEGNPDIAYVKGNYPGIVANTQTGNTIFILAVPSIITSKEITLLGTVDITTLSGTLMFNNESSINGLSFTPKVVYSGSTNPTSSDITSIVNNIQQAYTGTTIASINPSITSIVTTTGSDAIASLGGGILKEGLGIKVDSSVAPVVASSKFPGCDKNDIVVGTQTWSACNLGSSVAGTGASSYGNYYQWDRNDTGFTAAVDDYDWRSTTTSPTTYQNSRTDPQTYNGIQTWYTNKKGPCPSGRHVPTMNEWLSAYQTILSTGLTECTVSCSTAISNVENTLLLSRGGNISWAGGPVVASGPTGNSYYWSSTPSGKYSYLLTITSSYIKTQYADNRSNGFSVRCIKD